MTCPHADDTHWNLWGVQLAEHGGLTGWGIVAMLLFMAVVGAITVPAIDALTRRL